MQNTLFRFFRQIVLFGVLTAAMTVLGAMAGDSPQSIVIRTATLKAAPSFGARTLTILAVGSSVEQGKRLGGWQKVTVLPEATQSGWLRTYQVREDINATPSVVQERSSQRGVLSGLSSLSSSAASLFGKREMEGDSSNMTATIGVRGLSEADLENAKPDTQELQQIKNYAVSGNSAKQFADSGGLGAKKVKELPKPKKRKSKRSKRS